ncbi:MAG: hypothetical protein CME25_08630 [Gemmatimonadetes bacterium]|nr:hypothetical protein [Gemmatimonadota bacterium]|tara:strand:+ start:16859 stop:17866 length:1008 start_codon:yes stop_codon:yes gene_type:complete
METDRISVIVPCYNAADTIEGCVTSVLHTGYPALEIIVVDDHSNDDSARIVEKLAAKDNVIKLVRHGENGGAAKSRNTGASVATGAFLFFVDSDTEMLQDTLSNFLRRIKDTDAVTGIYHYEPLVAGPTARYKGLLNYYLSTKNGVVPFTVFHGACAGIHQKLFHELGGFNEQLRWGMDYENEEFGYRLAEKYCNLLDPEVVVKHLFPNFKKTTQTYFSRVSQWVQIFSKRRKFETVYGTATIGVSTASLLVAFASFPLGFFHKYLWAIPLLFAFSYLYGYLGFFVFVARMRIRYLPSVVLLNAYFTVVIALGAVHGFCTVLSGKSDIQETMRQL